MTIERSDVLNRLWMCPDVHMRVRRSGPHDVGSSWLMRGRQSCSLRIERPHDHPVGTHVDGHARHVIWI
jgi:hypothetical protein